MTYSEKEFGLFGRDPLPKHCVNNIKTRLFAKSGCKFYVKFKQGLQPMLCKARKLPGNYSSWKGQIEAGSDDQTSCSGAFSAKRMHEYIKFRVEEKKEWRTETLHGHAKRYQWCNHGAVLSDTIHGCSTVLHDTHGASYFGKINLSDA